MGELYKTRNKVAHNNLFTQKELDEAQKIYQDLIQTIENAEQKLEGLILTPEEVGLIQEEANSIEARQYPIEKLMDIAGKLPSEKFMDPLSPLRKSPSEKFMDPLSPLRKSPSEKFMDPLSPLRKSPSDVKKMID